MKAEAERVKRCVRRQPARNDAAGIRAWDETEQRHRTEVSALKRP